MREGLSGGVASRAWERPDGDAALDLPDATLREFGWSKVEAREGFHPEAIRRVLDDLRAEACAHSWRTFAVRGSDPRAVDALIAWEQHKRPTVMFAYMGIDAVGNEDVIGVGAVSDRISANFPFHGFPVIARCYVRPPYRGLRLYTAFLSHRYRYCQRRWGGALRAVHLGTANSAVHQVVTNPALITPPFRKVGVEALRVEHQVLPVAAYLAFQDDYASALVAAADHRRAELPAARAGLERLRKALTALIEGSPEADLFHVRAIARAIAAQVGWSGAEFGDAINGLLAFSDAITPYTKPNT